MSATPTERLRDEANLLLSRGDYKQAFDRFQALRRMEPENPDWSMRLGEIAVSLGEVVEAIDSYRRAAEGYAHQGSLVKAIAACKNVLDLDPSETEIQGMLAELFARNTGGSRRMRRRTGVVTETGGAPSPSPVTPRTATDLRARFQRSEPEPPPPPPVKGNEEESFLPRKRTPTPSPEPVFVKPAAPPAAPPAPPAPEVPPPWALPPLEAVWPGTAPGQAATPPVSSVETRVDEAGFGGSTLPAGFEELPIPPPLREPTLASLFGPAGSPLGLPPLPDLPMPGLDADAAQPEEVYAPAVPPPGLMFDADLGPPARRDLAPPPPPAPPPVSAPSFGLPDELLDALSAELESGHASTVPRPMDLPPAGFEPAPEAAPELTLEADEPDESDTYNAGIADFLPPAAPPAPPPAPPARPGPPKPPMMATPPPPPPPIPFDAPLDQRLLRDDLPVVQSSLLTEETDGGVAVVELDADEAVDEVVASMGEFLRADPNDGATRQGAPPAVVPETFDQPSSHSESFMRRLDMLPHVPLFSSLPPEELTALIEHLEVDRRRAGEVVIEEGAPGDAMFIVVSGQVEVTRGGAANVLARMGEGSFFGELALITADPRTATVTAVEPTEMLVMSRHVMGELLAAYPETLTTILSFVRGRLVATLLATSPLFTSFEMEERRELASEFELREIDPGTVLCAEGKRADALQIILAGQATVTRNGQPAGQLGAGDVVGEQSFLGSVATVTVTATRRIWTLALPRARFQEVVLSRPQILVYLSELADTRAGETGPVGTLGMV